MKLAVSESTLRAGLRHLKRHLEIKHNGFQFSNAMDTALKAWFEYCVDVGRLIRGTWLTRP
jgi:hypothetical protein